MACAWECIASVVSSSGLEVQLSFTHHQYVLGRLGYDNDHVPTRFGRNKLFVPSSYSSSSVLNTMFFTAMCIQLTKKEHVLSRVLLKGTD